MAYAPQSWSNDPSTPLSADRLNHIEAGVQAAAARADASRPSTWKPASADITDATTVGKAVVTAKDAAAARTAIGAGTSSQTWTPAATTLAGFDGDGNVKTYARGTITPDLLAADDAAAIRTLIGAGTSSQSWSPTGNAQEIVGFQSDGADQHENVTFALSDFGKSLLSVADAAAARTALGVGGQAEAQADSTATDIAGLVADFNALLAKLRTAGIIADGSQTVQATSAPVEDES